MQKRKNFREIFYYFLIFFVLFQGCKPKYLEEVNPQNQPKNNKMGIKTAQNWWQKQKTNRQNLQQKGTSDSLFEDYYQLDWQNGESRISQSGKLQIRVPILSKDVKRGKPLVKIQNKDNSYFIGQTEMLFQANPDSSFRTLLGITTTQDSTQLQKVKRNNFFTKTSDFSGSDFFFAFNDKKLILKNDFVNGDYASKQHSSSVCYMYSHSVEQIEHSSSDGGGGSAQPNYTSTVIEVRIFVEVACGDNSGSGGEGGGNWLGYTPTPGGYNPFPPYGGGGIGVGNGNPPADPFTPNYTPNNYPGKEDGWPFEWWKDEQWMQQNLKISVDDEDLTWAELVLCALNPFAANKLAKNRDEAVAKTNQLIQSGVLSGAYNGKADAFRHCFFNAMNARDIGITLAMSFGDAHESETPIELALEKEMDLHNNYKGVYGVFMNATPLNQENHWLAETTLEYVNDGKLKYLDPLAPNGSIIPGLTIIKFTNQ